MTSTHVMPGPEAKQDDQARPPLTRSDGETQLQHDVSLQATKARTVWATGYFTQ